MATTTITPDGFVEFTGTAPFTVTNAPGRVDPGLVFEWDFDGDGDFDDPLEDITSLVMAGESVTGRNYPSSLTGLAGAGRLRLTLLNTDDRFAYFNADSPLNAAPFSLRTGRKLRVRTTDAVADDPVLLARDRFNRSDGQLAVTETGQVWTNQLNGGFIVDDGEAVTAAAALSTNTVATIDVGTDVHYVQATLPRTEPGIIAGVVLLWEDVDNYWRVYLTTGQLTVARTAAGTPTLIDQVPVTPWHGMTIGAGIRDGTLTAYIAGVPVSETNLVADTGTGVGLYGFATSTANRIPAVDDFHVWDHVAGPVDGIVWTGEVEDVRVGGGPADLKVATVTAQGALASAAAADIPSPRVPTSGAVPGSLVGDVLARAGLLHPPHPLDAGTADMGPVGVDDNKALTLARMFEETERGFIHETNEGPIGFQSAAHRAGETSVAWFTDVTDRGQYPYWLIEPYDHKAQIVNRVTAGVAPSEPDGITGTAPTSDVAIGVTNHCDITLPTTAYGDMLVIFIVRANQASGVDWLTPIWWVNHRPDEPDALRTRVYSHWCDGTEGGTTVRFYTDSGAAGGAWVAHVFRIEDWFQSYGGIEMATFANGRTPNVLDHGWGRASTLYIACYAAMTSLTNGANDGMTYPDGYANGSTSMFTTNGDVLLATARKIDCVDAEAPTAFAGDHGFLIGESTVFAIRGYNGPHTRATLQNPRTTGGTGRFVTLDDTDSQDAHNAIRSHSAASVLFATEDDATQYAASVLALYADDRPIISLGFPAWQSAALRRQAIERRVGHKITVTATGKTGLGIEGDFFIEAITHRWPDPKRWECTWQLSPA